MDVECIRAAAAEQHPFAVVLSCAHSRVPPEIVFDQGIGDLFTVRVAGNVANGDEIASIEFAVEQLHTPLCVVVGHTGCAAIQAVLSGNRLPLEIDQLFRQIKTAVNEARAHAWLSGAKLVNAAVRMNVGQSVETLRNHLRKLIEQQKVHIVGAEYHMDCREVVWLDAQHQDRKSRPNEPPVGGRLNLCLGKSVLNLRCTGLALRFRAPGYVRRTRPRAHEIVFLTECFGVRD
ncbi:MAG: hypothetical protein JOZ62_23020 [Acidobacteriaceae bacterium]|nr:hypothetical protein [Acidobacteriaceae bacterium]